MKAVAIIIIIILGFIAYANSLNGEFIRDDITLIRDNIYIKSWSKVLKCFTKDIAIGGRQEWNSYRPFQMFTYMMDYSLWKLDVRGYHLTNIILHIIVALCIYYFLNILYDNKLLSLFASALFVVHPIHTNAICYISGRADSLVAIFMLLAFIIYIRILDKKNAPLYILMLLTYILALLSRENSLILPALLLLYHYAFKKKIKLNNLIPIICLALIYILLRLTVLRPLLFNVTYTTTLIERTPGFFVAVTNYIKLLLLPFNLYAGYGTKVFNLSDPKALLGILISLFLLIYAFRIRAKNNLVVFSICWFFITLLPQSNLYPINAYMAEHWLYIPSIGFFLVLAKGLSYLYKNKKFQAFTIVLIISLLAFYSFLTIRQNNYWRESIAFYERTFERTPDNVEEYLNLGNVYKDLGEYDKAIASYKKVIEFNPNSAKAYNNLGAMYHYTDRKIEAIAAYKKAIEIKPDYDEAYNNLGVTYKDLGRYDEAIVSYRRSIKINPEYASPYYNLGEIYINTDRYEEAIEVYKEAIEINPTYADAYNNMGVCYSKVGKTKEAISSFKKAVEIDPDYADAYNNLALTYYNIGKKEEATTAFKKVVEIDPSRAAVHRDLAIVYYQNEEYDLAVKHCDKAIGLGHKIHPEFLKLLEPYRK